MFNGLEKSTLTNEIGNACGGIGTCCNKTPALGALDNAAFIGTRALGWSALSD